MLYPAENLIETEMKISIKSLISFTLGIALFAGFQGGRYFMQNRLQEVGIAAAMALFLYAALQSAFVTKNFRWSWWCFVPPVFILAVMGCYSVIYSFNANTICLPSFMASREYMLIFIAPAVYLLYQSGYEIKRIEHTFVIVLVALLFHYLFHYFTMDMRAAFLSSDPTVASLVVYDEWRGYRLKAPTSAIVILVLYSGIRLFQPGKLFTKSLFLFLICVCFYIWSFFMPRQIIAVLVLTLSLYPLWFSRPNRTNLLALGIPLAVIVLIMVCGKVVHNFENAEGGEMRMASYRTAWQIFSAHPVLGFGRDSQYSKTYQDIFGEHFHPSDIGIFGIAFKYGLVGIVTYIYLNLNIIFRLIKVKWCYRKHHGKQNPLVWSLFIYITAMFLILIIQPALSYAQGLTVASFCMGYTACYFEEMGLRQSNVQRSSGRYGSAVV